MAGKASPSPTFASRPRAEPNAIEQKYRGAYEKKGAAVNHSPFFWYALLQQDDSILFTALQGLLQWFPFLAGDSLFDVRQDVEK